MCCLWLSIPTLISLLLRSAKKTRFVCFFPFENKTTLNRWKDRHRNTHTHTKKKREGALRTVKVKRVAEAFSKAKSKKGRKGEKRDVSQCDQKKKKNTEVRDNKKKNAKRYTTSIPGKKKDSINNSRDTVAWEKKKVMRGLMP